jgi:acyl-CoA thioesterase-1
MRTLSFCIKTLLLCMALVGGASHAATKSILVLGDSLSAAYGIAAARGWVALLGERVARERPDYRVVNASISGETSAGGRARIAGALARHRPAVVIVELGGNDGLRGLTPAQMKDNLAAIVSSAQQAGARVLLVGMKVPPNYGPEYAERFERVFAEVQKRYRTALVPFLLEGFAERPELFQSDGIHPTEQAQPLILERVWPALAPLLKK